MGLFRCLLLVVLLGFCLGDVRRFDGYKVLRITPTDEVKLRGLRRLQQSVPDKMSFWKEPSHVGGNTDVMIAPEHLDEVRSALYRLGLDSTVMIEDVQPLVDMSTQGQPGGVGSLVDFDYDVYHTYDEINAWAQDMATDHSAIVSQSLMGAGKSYENQDIRVMKVGNPAATNKPIVFLVSGTHSREWLSPASLFKIVDFMVTEYEAGNAEIVGLLDSVDFYAVPILNPDGYAYTQTDRMWRKTRSPNSWTFCPGTDPNRNFNAFWGNTDGADTNMCSDAYMGANAESEIEVSTLTGYIQSLSNVKVFIDMHCYSQLWMTPYGYDYILPDNYGDQLALADAAMLALENVNGLVFETGSIANVIYKASGNSADWAFSVAGIQYAFAPELRDKGRYGFLAPESFIDPSAREVYAALKVILERAMSL